MNRTKSTAIFVAILSTFIIAKAIVTGANHITMTHAIYAYQIECRAEGVEYHVTQKAKEEFGETFWRWWDWGNKRILTPQDDMIIRPYIGRLTSADFVGQYFE